MDKEYENAFSKAKAAYGTGAYDDATIEFLFPQLTKSEDDKANDKLVDLVNRHCSGKEKDRLLFFLEKWKKGRGWRPTLEQINMLTSVCSGLHMKNHPDSEYMDNLLKQLEQLYWGVYDKNVSEDSSDKTVSKV